MEKKSCFLIIIGLLVWNIGLSQNSYPSSGNAIINELRIGKYGGTLSGDPDPYNIYTPGSSGNHDLILFGSSSATLNLRLYDGDFKIGTSSAPTTIRNDGSAFFGGDVGIGTPTPDALLELSGSGTQLKVDAVGAGSDAIIYMDAARDNGVNHNVAKIIADASTGDSNTTLNFDIVDGDNAGWNRTITIKATNGSLNTGFVGIGTTSPTELLTVNGTAKAEEVIVVENVGADFVFEEDYALPELSEVEAHIKQHKRLPEIPSAEEMIEDGVKVGDLQMKLLQKVEELTLYILDQEKRIRELETIIQTNEESK